MFLKITITIKLPMIRKQAHCAHNEVTDINHKDNQMNDPLCYFLIFYSHIFSSYLYC